MKSIVTYHLLTKFVVALLFVGMFSNALLLSSDAVLDFIPENIELIDLIEDCNEKEDSEVEKDAESKVVISPDILSFLSSSQAMKADIRLNNYSALFREILTPPPNKL